MDVKLGEVKDGVVVAPVVRGAVYRAAHKASVQGILGGSAPEVRSQGSLFYNKDKWTARLFVEKMCKWAADNVGCMPTLADVTRWVADTNSERFNPSEREICIAATPEELSLRVALGLTGGAYHESFHSKYSRRKPLDVAEMAAIVLPRWTQLADWSKVTQALLKWSNLIEDIRIERRGREDYPGTLVKLHDLQDLILGMEYDSEKQLPKGQPVPAMCIIEASFRDVGLGYDTPRQRESFVRYQKHNPQATAMVMDGPLTNYVLDSIELPTRDDLGCLRLAMDVLVVLGALAGENKEQNQQKGQGKPACPKCGGKLVVRPMSDGRGGKVPGKGLITCTKCGWQQEVSIEPKPSQQPSAGDGDEGEDGIEMEGFDQPQPGAGKGQGKGQGKDKGKDSGKDDKGQGKAGKGQDQGKGEGEGKDKDGKGGKGDKPNRDLGPDQEPSPGSKSGRQPKAGGHSEHKGPVDGSHWDQVAADALKDGNKASGLLDAASALEQAFADAQKAEDKDVEYGEKPWRPFSAEQDTAATVGPSGNGIEADKARADKIITSVTQETTYLRSRLRTIIRSLEMTAMQHGAPRGKRLSNRYLVDTLACIKAGDKPNRAYVTKGIKLDMSVAIAVVLDESGSISSSGLKQDFARVCVALTEPFDSLRCPTLVVGVRNGGYGYSTCNVPNNWYDDYLRVDGTHYDIFKGWNERFGAVRWRFANTLGQGGTPLSDGVQFALTALNGRCEGHRVMFVVTDGEPDSNHKPVMKRQIRLAQQAGIHVIGVGVGDSARSVQRLFPDHVWTPNVRDLPAALLKKLNERIDFNAGKRGTRATDGDAAKMRARA